MAHLPVVPESKAQGDVKQVFEEIQRKNRLPFVPNFFRSLKKLQDSNAALESLVAQRTASLRNLSQRPRLLKTTSISGMRLDQITRDVAEVLKFSGSSSNANCALRTLRRMLHKAEEWKLIRNAPKLKLMKE